MLPARMLKDKGIVEFIEAANSIKSKYFDKAIFKLVGDVDLGNPSGLSKDYLESIADGEYIQWLGYQKEMKQQYVDSDIVVLPSYREGLPKSLIEANAIGRPIITTDVPGCRECVNHKVNGILIPVKNSEALADSFSFFIENPSIIKNYSRKSRLLAEELFSIENVVNTHMEIYQKYFKKKIFLPAQVKH
jgi:glycosyltransferase involved in cell wall biosynthesis